MKKIIYALFAVFCGFSLFCQENKSMGSPCKFTVMRGNDTVYHLGSIPAILGDTTYLCQSDSFSLKLSVSGANCFCNSLQWKKIGVSIPNATSYTVNIADTGRYTFDIFCSPNGTILNFGPVIQVMSCSITGLRESTKSGFLIFPNPTDEKINIQLDNSDNTTVVIYNALGQVVLVKRSLKKVFEMDISSLNNGVYYVSIENEQIKSMQKIIKNTR